MKKLHFLNNWIIVAFVFISVLMACVKDKGKLPQAAVSGTSVLSSCDSTGTISYSLQIVPILNTSCGTNSGGCHSAISSFGDLTNYNGVKIHLPGMMLHAVEQDDPINYKPMPLVGPKLPACEIGKIRNWISQGYPDN